MHAISKRIYRAFGLKSLYADVGKVVKLRIHSGATAAIGIARKQGLGKLRHLDCADLWIQAKVWNTELTLVKVLGTSNPTNILTKHLDQKTLQSALRISRLHRILN